MDKLIEALVYCGEELAPWIRSSVEKAGNYTFRSLGGNVWEAVSRISAKSPAAAASRLAIIEYGAAGNAPEDFARLAELLNQKAIPYIVMCRQAKNGFDAMYRGASNMIVLPAGYVGSPSLSASGSTPFFVSQLTGMLKSFDPQAGDSRVLKRNFPEPVRKLIAIGASTGGSDAVNRIISEMPADTPPIVAVMHMPPVFTKIFAERLHSLSKISVWEARDGDRLRSGLALVARGDKHLTLARDSSGYFVKLNDSEPIGGFRPSVNLFFESVAKTARSAAVGVILTGMGADGASGITEMRMTGAFTIGQDEASCVVYGMPKVAWEMGGISAQVPLNDIAGKILDAVKD